MSEQLRSALSPAERQFALLRSKYERGEELELEEGAKMVELEGKMLFEQGVRDIKRVALEAGKGIDSIGTFVSRKIGTTVKEVGKKLAANMPNLNEKQQMMLKRLVELRAIEEGNDDIPLEVTAEIRTLESVLSMTQGVNEILNLGDKLINGVADLIADTFPSRRMAKLSPGLAMIVVGGLAGAACTGGSAFGAPRLTDTAGSPRTSTPMPTITPTSTERPATTTPIEQVDPTETAWPTPTPVKTETATPEAKKVTVDAEGFMGDGLMHLRVDSTLYRGTEIKLYDGADQIYYKHLYELLTRSPRFQNLEWLQRLDPTKPWEGEWGKVQVVMPLSVAGSGFVDSVKNVELDLSRPIYFDLRQEVSVKDVEEDFYSTAYVDSYDTLVGFGLTVDDSGEIHATYYDSGSPKMGSYTEQKRVRYTTGYVLRTIYWFEGLLFGRQPLEAGSGTSGIWNGYGDGYGFASRLDPMFDVVAIDPN